MRVLHIGKYYPPFSGGIENFLGDLLPSLLAYDITPAALVHAHDWQPEGRSGNKVIAGVSITRVPTWGRFLYAPLSPLFPKWLHQAIVDFKPTILHFHLPNTSAFWAFREPLAKSIPWIIHWHADVVASHLDRRLALAYPLYRPLEQLLLRRAHTIMVTSPPYKDSSLALAPWKEKCRILPLGLNRARLGLPDPIVRQAATALWIGGGLRLLAIGRLTYYKGQEVLIRAVAEVPESQLILIGEGEQRRQLDNLVHSLDLRSRVHLLGHLPGAVLQGLLASCDCLCLPSLERTEAFGLVLLEAMHYGRPVISSDVSGSGMGWVIEDHKSGLLVPPGNVQALASAIRELAANSDMRKRMGSAGKIRLKKFFTIEPIAAQLADIYRDILMNNH